MNLDDALHTFVAESRELLQDMERALLGIEQAEDRSDAVNAIFRAAHTIKGSAGLFGLDPVVRFTHVVESVLDGVRDGRVAIDDDLVTLLLACGDHSTRLIDAVADGTELPEADGQPLVDRLQVYLGTPAAASPTAAADAPAAAAGTDTDGCWLLSLRFGADVLRHGMDPLSFLRYLGKLGKVTGIVTISDGLPDAEEMDPESCYLAYKVAFESNADKTAIEGVFDFVRDEAEIHILPPKSKVRDYIALIEDAPGNETRIGELLVACGALTPAELADALDKQAADEAHPRVGEVLVQQGAIQGEVVEAAAAKQQKVAAAKAQESRSIRVDANRLDHLINLIGELVIAGASTHLIARNAAMPDLTEAASRMAALVEEVRDSALQLRMVRIGATFDRFHRVVRETARDLGKDIALVISGEDTELDKTVVEKIADPLTHLVRNSIDHGIEPAEKRVAAGKPAQGTVRLNAYHESGSIVIEVTDDGGGLRRDRILGKAIERGLVQPGEQLSDDEVNQLIFEPGFSTADKVSDLSGRGVGMDVVKRNITALRGSIAITSREGEGTSISVRLPLTLAIIDGFLVTVGGATFVVPLECIEECIEYSAEAGHSFTNLRGAALPFITLRERFEIDGTPPRRPSIVVVRHAGHRAGLVVDALLGEFQTVIKPLGRMFGQVAGISGSTILGGGEVALILDIPALLASAAVQPTPPGAARLHASLPTEH